MMRSIFIIVLSGLLALSSEAQPDLYEQTIENPFGLLNPSAPKEVGDYEKLIGKSNCMSINRNTDGSWQDSVRMSWTFKYIMDGTAIQDITLKDDGLHTTSVRLYRSDSAKWYVTFFSKNNPRLKPGAYVGETVEGGDIVLFKNTEAPNGLKGVTRLTFSNISKTGFDWEGVFTTEDKSLEFSFWRIHCDKAE